MGETSIIADPGFTGVSTTVLPVPVTLGAASLKPIIYVCETCRFSNEQATAEDGRSGGQILYDLLMERRAGSDRVQEYEIRTTRCLMGCDHHCNLHFRAPGKINYVVGRFEPDAQSADAIVDYFEKYLESETGQVPYKTWPQGIKGHFIARTPPLED